MELHIQNERETCLNLKEYNFTEMKLYDYKIYLFLKNHSLLLNISVIALKESSDTRVLLQVEAIFALNYSI